MRSVHSSETTRFLRTAQFRGFSQRLLNLGCSKCAMPFVQLCPHAPPREAQPPSGMLREAPTPMSGVGRGVLFGEARR